MTISKVHIGSAIAVAAAAVTGASLWKAHDTKMDAKLGSLRGEAVISYHRDYVGTTDIELGQRVLTAPNLSDALTGARRLGPGPHVIIGARAGGEHPAEVYTVDPRIMDVLGSGAAISDAPLNRNWRDGRTVTLQSGADTYSIVNGAYGPRIQKD